MKNQEEIKVTLDTAILANELGFDSAFQSESYYQCISVDGFTCPISGDKIIFKRVGNVYRGKRPVSYQHYNRVACAPTQRYLQKWLEDNYQLFLDVTFNGYSMIGEHGIFRCVAKDKWRKTIFEAQVLLSESYLFQSYESALERGLFKLLQHIGDNKL